MKQPPHTEVRSMDVRSPNGWLVKERKEVTVVPAMPEVPQPAPSPIPASPLPSTTISATVSTSSSTLPVPKTGSAMIGLFEVSPAYQSHGIGDLLINHSISHIRDVWNCARIFSYSAVFRDTLEANPCYLSEPRRSILSAALIF